jgi:hypothetical protein
MKPRTKGIFRIALLPPIVLAIFFGVVFLLAGYDDATSPAPCHRDLSPLMGRPLICPDGGLDAAKDELVTSIALIEFAMILVIGFRRLGVAGSR